MSLFDVKRKQLKIALLADQSRKDFLDILGFCEGQAFEPHICNSGIHMNEVLFSRERFKTLPKRLQEYFISPINCMNCCPWFHTNHGHSRAFREFWVDKMMKFYGEMLVIKWIDNAPLKIKHL